MAESPRGKRRCELCQKPLGRDFLCCGRCGLAAYCGRDCQRGHWRAHKPACTLQPPAAGAGSSSSSSSVPRPPPAPPAPPPQAAAASPASEAAVAPAPKAEPLATAPAPATAPALEAAAPSPAPAVTSPAPAVVTPPAPAVVTPPTPAATSTPVATSSAASAASAPVDTAPAEAPAASATCGASAPAAASPAATTPAESETGVELAVLPAASEDSTASADAPGEALTPMAEEVAPMGEDVAMEASAPAPAATEAPTPAQQPLVLPEMEQAGQEGLYEVEHRFVFVRTSPSRKAGGAATATQGMRMYGTPYRVGEELWLRLSAQVLPPPSWLSVSAKDTHWVMVDASGTDLGLGALLRRVADGGLPEDLPSCPNGHALHRYSSPAGLRCQVCLRVPSGGGEMWGCQPCEYDRCSRCKDRRLPCSPDEVALAARGLARAASWRQRAAAVDALGHSAVWGGEGVADGVLDKLAPQLRHEHWRVRAAARRVLKRRLPLAGAAELGEVARRAAEAPRPERRAGGCEWSNPSTGVSALLRAALAQEPPADEAARGRLLAEARAALAQQGPAREPALDVLGRLGTSADIQTSVPSNAKEENDPYARMARASAAAALWSRSPCGLRDAGQQATTRILHRSLKNDTDAEVRAEAARALAALPERGRRGLVTPLLQALSPAVSDRSIHVRRLVAEVMLADAKDCAPAQPCLQTPGGEFRFSDDHGVHSLEQLRLFDVMAAPQLPLSSGVLARTEDWWVFQRMAELLLEMVVQWRAWDALLLLSAFAPDLAVPLRFLGGGAEGRQHLLDQGGAQGHVVRRMLATRDYTRLITSSVGRSHSQHSNLHEPTKSDICVMVGSLCHENRSIRQEAWNILRKNLQEKGVAGAVDGLLGNPLEEVRLAATRFFMNGSMPDAFQRPTVQDMVAWLEDGDWRVGQVAVRVLGRLVAAGEESAEVPVAQKAASCLASMVDAQQPLEEDHHATVLARALKVLARLTERSDGDQAAVFAQCFEDCHSANLRDAAFRATKRAAEHGGISPAAVEVFASRAVLSQSTARTYAGKALRAIAEARNGRMAPVVLAASAAWLPFATSLEGRSAIAAVISSGMPGNAGVAGTQLLCEMLKSEGDPTARLAAMNALAISAAPNDPPARAALRSSSLKERQEDLREAARSALATLESRASEAATAQAASSGICRGAKPGALEDSRRRLQEVRDARASPAQLVPRRSLTDGSEATLAQLIERHGWSLGLTTWRAR